MATAMLMPGIGITGLREEDAGGRMARVNPPFRALRRDARNGKHGDHGETQQERQLRGEFHRNFRFGLLNLIVRLSRAGHHDVER